LTEERIREVLRDFGVTEKEAEIYIFLAKHGALRGGEISKRAKTHKALVYRILDSLQGKGLVTKTLEAPACFTAVNFETVIDLKIKAKREEATLLENTKRELLSYWKNIRQAAAEPALERFTVIEGNHKIYPKISQMIKETEKQLCVVATVPGLMRAEQYGVLDAAFDHPSRSKIKFRFLTEMNEQNLGEVEALLRKAPKAGFDLKGRNPALGLSLLPRMVIRDSQEILFFITPVESGYTTEKDEVCLWTNSKALIQAFTAVFEDLWSNATNIIAKMATIDFGRLRSKTTTIPDARIARNRYNAVMSSAKKEVIMMTSAKGLTAYARNTTMLNQITKKGIHLRIMAPIVNENLEAVERLGKNHDVRHVQVSYIETTVVDGKHLFQFKNPEPSQEGNGTSPNFENTYYSDDPRQVRRISTMLNNVWKNATVSSSSVTLESFLGSSSIQFSTSYSGGETGRPASSRVGDEQKDLIKSTPNQMMNARRSTGAAVIHPPSYFDVPDMVIEVHHYQPQSALGEGNTLEVYLQLKTPKGFEYAPVAILETNPHPDIVFVYKKLYAGTPAAQNIQLVKPEQLQARLTGKNFFAGWTVPIPLPPTSKSLPPSCILFEGYGKIENKTYTWPFPSGFKAMIDWTGLDAFVTFLDPTWKYAGPGTQGRIGTNVVVTAIPPTNK
jgi:sugar-specific transcriptional regulator TrmB